MRLSASGLARFVRDLRKRRVHGTVVLYAAAAFVILQVADILVDALGLPDWVLSMAVWGIILGFPPVVLISWAFDLGPHGLERTAPDVEGVRPRSSRLVVATAVILGLVGAAIFSTRRVAPGGAEGHTVAVLPFGTLGGSEEDEYFGDGISEDLLTDLAAVEGLRVISRSSVAQYKRSEKDARAIGAELGARWLIEGTVRRGADHLRITARMVDARSGASVWGDGFEGSLDDLFGIQSTIVRRVVETIGVEIDQDSQARLSRAPTGSFVAYDLTLRGRSHLDRLDRESNELAITFARQSLAADPGFAPGHALLGSALANRVRFGYGPEWADSALAAAQRSIVLDPELGEGFRALGSAYIRLGRYEEALAAYERAADINPSDQRAIASAAAVYSFQGRPVEALEFSRWAIEIDPLSPDVALMLQNVVALYLDLDMVSEAEHALARARALDPGHQKNSVLAIELALRRGDQATAVDTALALVSAAPTDPYALILAGDAHLFAGAEAEASQLYHRAYGLGPQAEGIRHFVPVLLAWCLQREGDRKEAERLLAEFEEFARTEVAEGSENYTLFYSMATARLMRDDPAGATEWLERANAAAGVVLEWPMAHDPLLQPLRATDEFARQARRVGRKADSLRAAVLDASARPPAQVGARRGREGGGEPDA